MLRKAVLVPLLAARFLITGSAAECQTLPTVPVTVTIRSHIDSLPIAAALVWVADVDAARQIVAPALRRISLSAGHGSVQIPEIGQVALIAGGLGYDRDTVVLQIDHGKPVRELTMWLDRSPVQLPPISVVTARQGQSSRPSPGTGFRRTQAELRLSPPGMAVDDPVRALAVEPGIRLSEPFSSRLVVRGSDPSGTATYVNGFPVHNLIHIGGLFSALPAAAVERQDVWTAPPPARYDGHGGATIDMSTEPTQEGFRGESQLSAMSAELVGGWRGGSSMLRVAARRSWLDGVWANAVNARDFGFGDALLMGRIAPSSSSTVAALVFMSGDHIRDPDVGTPGAEVDSFNYRRSTSLIGLSASSQLGRSGILKLRGWNTRASTGGAHMRVSGTANADAHNELDEFGIMASLDWGRSATKFSAGLMAIRRRVLSAVSYYRVVFEGSRPVHFGLSHLQFDTKHVLLRAFGSASLSIPRLGSLTGEFATSSVANILLPGARLEWRHEFSPTVQAYASAGRTFQTTQLLTDPRQELWSEFSSVDVWFAASDSTGKKIPAVRTDQLTVGFRHRPSANIEIRLEAYRKRSDDRAELGAPDPAAGGAALGLRFVTEQSAGIDLAVDWRVSSVLRVDASYSLARALHETPTDSYLSNYDVPHRFQALASVERPTGFVGSIAATLESGYPYDPYLFAYENLPLDPYHGFVPSPFNLGGLSFVRGPHNSERLGVSHRVDAQIGYRHGHGNFRWEVFLAVANLSSGQEFPLRPEGQFRPGSEFGKVRLKPIISLPPVPFIGIRVGF